MKQFCNANMTSTVVEGTKYKTGFLSKDVSISHENIVVHISQDFKAAQYSIDYTIKSDIAGGQIPLLFLAKDHKGNFSVYVDGKLVKRQDITSYIIKQEYTLVKGFCNSFPEKIDDNKYISKTW